MFKLIRIRRYIVAVASSGGGSEVSIFNIKTREEIIKWEPTDTVLDNGVLNVAFSPDEFLLAVGERYGSVQIFELNTKKEKYHFKHDDDIESMNFSPDGRYLATAGYDKTLRIWDLHNNNKETKRFIYNDVPIYIAFTTDGNELVSEAISDDNKAVTVRRHLFGRSTLTTEVCARLHRNLTCDEWESYFEKEPYRKVCENLPAPSNYCSAEASVSPSVPL